MNTRLSRKAQEAAATFANGFDQYVRHIASSMAKEKNKEFADEVDVEAAYKLALVRLAAEVRGS